MVSIDVTGVQTCALPIFNACKKTARPFAWWTCPNLQVASLVVPLGRPVLQGRALPLQALRLQGLQLKVQVRKVLALRALADPARARAVLWP
jgi:hypothetical protein